MDVLAAGAVAPAALAARAALVLARRVLGFWAEEALGPGPALVLLAEKPLGFDQGCNRPPFSSKL